MWSHRSYILVQYCRRDTAREWLDTTCTTRTGRETMVYRLYRSWINGDMHIISNTALQPRQYNPYRSWNNGSRVLQLVNCIDIYILMISNSAELIRPVNDWRDKYTKDNACSSLWKRECPKAQNTTNILRESPIAPEYAYSALRSPKAGEAKCATKYVCKAWEPKSAIHSSDTNRESREKHVRQGQCVLFKFVLKRECPNTQSTMNILRSQNMRAQ